MTEKQKAELLETIMAILRRKNDVLIQNRKDGIIVVEQQKTIAYRAELKQ